MTQESMIDNAERQRRYRAGPRGQAWWREYRKRPAVIAAAVARDASKRAAHTVVINAAKSPPCADCGVEYPPYVMDFDHVRGIKKFNVSKSSNHSMQALLEEIAKCEVVCSNCHRERTHGT